jgi:DNA-binding Lrp family transcriptional regulator
MTMNKINYQMDDLDRLIINELQGGFPICDAPFVEVASRLQSTEAIVISRIENLLKQGILSRFGPLYHAERMGGSLSLAAMQIPDADFERVAAIVNALPEVAHNYARDHRLNMWFVLATETTEEQTTILQRIEQDTGCQVFDMPKIKEYYIGLRLAV